MRRGKEAPVSEPAVVSVRMIATEMQSAHRWVSGSAENDAWAAERVTEMAARIGVDVAGVPAWLPTMSVTQAKELYRALTAERDPLEVAQDLDRERVENYMADPTLRPAELVKHFGAALGRPGVVPPQSEAYGPRDPYGKLRAQTRYHEQLLDGETSAARYVAVPSED